MKACAGNLAGAFGGSEISNRWNDLYKPQVVRDAQEIIETIKGKIDKIRSNYESF